MKLYESRLSYFNDKATINHCKPLSVHQHGGPSRPRQNCHSCIFETNENSNLRICIQYLGHHSKTTCQKSAKSMRYRVRPNFEFYRKSLLNILSFAAFRPPCLLNLATDKFYYRLRPAKIANFARRPNCDGDSLRSMAVLSGRAHERQPVTHSARRSYGKIEDCEQSTTVHTASLLSFDHSCGPRNLSECLP